MSWADGESERDSRIEGAEWERRRADLLDALSMLLGREVSTLMPWEREEIAHDAIVDVLMKLSRTPGGVRHPWPYLRRVAKNRALSRLRRRPGHPLDGEARDAVLDGEVDPLGQQKADWIEAREIARRFLRDVSRDEIRFLASLSDPSRTLADVARELHVSRRTIQRRARRLRCRLEEMLQDGEDTRNLENACRRRPKSDS